MKLSKVEFLEINVNKSDLETIGEDAAALLLTIVMFAEEVNHLRMMLMASIAGRPENPTLAKVAVSRDHMYIRLLNLKVCETIFALGGFLENRRKKRNAEQAEQNAFEAAVEKCFEPVEALRHSKWHKFSKQMRNHLGGHTPPSEVKSWLKADLPNADGRMLFHDTMGASSFPTVDDWVFAGFLETHLEAETRQERVEKYQDFLDWLLLDASSEVIRAAHILSKGIFVDHLGRDQEATVEYEFPSELVQKSGEFKLPLLILAPGDARDDD
ncbi:hypothetical protein [Celeribacter sp. PS-C1]|uniref:hypothetical protein n=1 Tax=Celeribacter sp. PS-C1 TaxID=2820813 RepID=UPI001CA5B42C|nr:hypothetical protein [Celeribacter sp. PS-C1]MBW6418676.1 hypothetical protein [Celeribacter sp. PS-C1]